MCKSPEHIKLCTCADDSINVEELNSYWILYRYNPSKEFKVLGSVVMPDDIPGIELLTMEGESEQDMYNRVLLERLNKNELFDTDISLTSNDRLQVVFNSLDEFGGDIYEFEYVEGEWDIAEDDPTDPFFIDNNYDEYKQGVVE